MMTLVAVPLSWFVAYLTTKFNVPKMLIFTDIFCLINLWIMIKYAKQAGSWQFATAYFIGETLDGSNFIFTATMMMSKLKAESRGAIMSINSVAGSFGAIFLLWMQAEVQKRNGDNFGSGAEEVFTNYWMTLFGYWLLVIIYVIFSKEGSKKESEDSTKDDSLELK